MDKTKRREAVQAYKERKRSAGVFAVRCTATGETWTGSTRNLDTQKNAVWFMLRHDGHPNAALQAAWRAHGEDAFAYEVLAALSDEDLAGYAVASRLKTLEEETRLSLGARKLVG